MSNEYQIVAEVEDIEGSILTGSYVANVKKSLWDKLTDSEKQEYVEAYGEFVINDYNIESVGEIAKFEKSIIKTEA